MKILVVQHSAADGPGAFAQITGELGCSLTVHRADTQPQFPDTVDHDMLACFGGAFSLAVDSPPDWVEKERELIRRYVDGGKRVFGICLGAQMIASALGAEVRRNRVAEVGWHDVIQVDPQPSSLVKECFPESWKTLHWHQDTFAIPDGAHRLCWSEACDNQAYAIGDQVFGFQCHLEANEQIVRIFSAVGGIHRSLTELPDSVQPVSQIEKLTRQFLAGQTEILRKFLTAWLA